MAVIPAAIVIYVTGDKGAYKLLILSQVVLSLQLPFAVIPLIRFTSDPTRMGSFVSRLWVRILAWTVAFIIVGLNLWLAYNELGGWHAAIAVPLALGLLGLLGWVSLAPLGRRTAALNVPEATIDLIRTPEYRSILVPIDHSALARIALAHAAGLAKPAQAEIHLRHVEEGVASLIHGEMAQTAEIAEGQLYFEQLLASLNRLGLTAEITVVYDTDPTSAIIRHARKIQPDLLVMGAHGHKGLKDIVFGATINEVRHAVGVPVLIVRDLG